MQGYLPVHIFRFHKSADVVLCSRDLTFVREIPVLDTSDYGGNWQTKVLER